jgi:hypothetical protein
MDAYSQFSPNLTMQQQRVQLTCFLALILCLCFNVFLILISRDAVSHEFPVTIFTEVAYSVKFSCF